MWKKIFFIQRGNYNRYITHGSSNLCPRMSLIFLFGKIDFQSLCKFPPREHDPPPTTFAFKADIRTETRDSPFVGAAWMLFAQP